MNEIQRSTEDIHNYLLLKYRKKVMEVEMKVFQARQTRMKDKLQRYFNSTPLRNAFARWMVFAFYDKSFYTITQLTKEMYTSRQTVSAMIDECEKEGYITVIRKGKTVKCQAAQPLIDKSNDYCEWRKWITKNTIGKAYYDLILFEKWMNIEFHK